MSIVKVFERTRYLLWAMSRFPFDDRSCPACASIDTSRIKRKALVTSLYHCRNCDLLFRVPRETVASNRLFYQRRYNQGFTTDCPDDATLARLLQHNFHGSSKDYSAYIDILQTAGVVPGQTILDYGASWGYGTWQLQQVGYKVVGYEISAPRARYAVEKLGCIMIDAPTSVPTQVDCMFSAHVIEHLPDPTIFWKVAQQVVAKNGVVVLYTPNGNPVREHVSGSQYHRLWGHVHPLLLTGSALEHQARRYGFAGVAYSSPYGHNEIKARTGGNLLGDELLFIAWRS
jgi:2-polyprenyl-3-methyl-5-hydroxy-6-metoxy-1,4-benzoquinol methylase